jgi:hypothetical protein
LQAIADQLRIMQMPDTNELSTSIQGVADVEQNPEDLYEKGWPKGCAGIYRISTDERTAQQLWESADAENARRKEEAARHKEKSSDSKPKNDYQMARLNDWQEGRTCLYVGKAEKLTPRLLQHLGPHSKSTYAMHLSMWAPAKLWSALIRIEYWPLTELQLSEASKQALEDYIWEESAPVFGKQGPK